MSTPISVRNVNVDATIPLNAGDAVTFVASGQTPEGFVGMAFTVGIAGRVSNGTTRGTYASVTREKEIVG